MADPKSTALKGGLGMVKRLLSPKEKYVPGVHYADPLAPPTMRMSEALGNVGAEGKTLNFTEADRSRVFGPNRGGVGFSGLQHYSEPHKQAGTSWGFGSKGIAEKKVRQNKPDESLWTTFVGAPEQHKSNTVVIQDAINDFQQAARAGKVHPAQIKLMNERLRNLRDDKTGALLFDKSFDLTDPDALSAATTFNRRSGIGDVLMGEGVKGGMRSKAFKAEHGSQVWNPAGDMETLLKRETDPDLVGAGTYDVGNRLFTMEGDVVYRPDLNIAFPWQTTGQDLGVKYELAPKEAAMRDWMKQYEGRIGKGGKPAPVGYMDLARNQPSQFVDEDYLTFLQKLGRKDGGEVNMEEADARLRAAIDEHMAQGGEVDLDAAEARLNAAVAQHMAGGGEMVKGAAKGFKRLFGEKVLPAVERDANLQKFLEPSKTPMRLYHATTATEGGKGEEAIRRLKPSKEGALGSGAYMTPKADFANQYAEGVGGNVLPVHAQIKNPLILEGKGDPMIEALVKLGVDENKAANMVERAYDQKGYIGKEVQTRAQAQGYDGLMQYRDGDLNEVVTYQPGAVKSAIGNEGTYDPMQLDLNKAEGGAAFKKLQFMDKGGITTSGGTFSAEDIDPSVRHLPKDIREDIAKGALSLEDELGRLKKSQRAREQLAKIAGAQAAGSLSDIANFGLLGVDFVKDLAFTKPRPRSVLEGPYDPSSIYAHEHERVPRFGSIREALQTKDGLPIGGTEHIIKRAQEAGLMGPSRFPVLEFPTAILGGMGLAKAGNKVGKGYTKYVEPRVDPVGSLSHSIDALEMEPIRSEEVLRRSIKPISKKTQSRRRGGLTQLKAR